MHICARIEIRVNFERLSRPQFLPDFKNLFFFVIFEDLSVDYIYYFWNRFHRNNDFNIAPTPFCPTVRRHIYDSLKSLERRRCNIILCPGKFLVDFDDFLVQRHDL